MKVSKDEDGDQSRPDLNMKRISRGSDEGLDAQVLLDGSEKRLDLPPVFVNRSNGRCGKAKLVGEEHQIVTAVGIDHLDPSKDDQIDSRELFDQHDVFVQDNGAALGNRPGGEDLISRSIFHARDEENASLGELVKPLKIVVSAIENQDRISRKIEPASDIDVKGLGIRDDGKLRQISVMIEEQVQLDPTFGSAKLCPIEQSGAQIDGGDVEREEFVFETKPMSGCDLTASLEKRVKDRFEKLPRPMGVGVGQGRSRWSDDPQVTELPLRRGQTVTDLPKGLRSSKLAEQHGHELGPTRKPTGMALGSMRSNLILEVHSRKKLEDL